MSPRWGLVSVNYFQGLDKLVLFYKKKAKPFSLLGLAFFIKLLF